MGFIWVPAYMSMEGNKEADYLAKNAAHRGQSRKCPTIWTVRIHFNHKQVSQRNMTEYMAKVKEGVVFLHNTENSGKSKKQFCLQKKRFSCHNQVEAWALWA